MTVAEQKVNERNHASLRLATQSYPDKTNRGNYIIPRVTITNEVFIALWVTSFKQEALKVDKYSKYLPAIMYEP